MRAICDSCSQPQPRDWRPGDLCIHCGQAAREEVRCFWCAKWTPAAKFCRKCGADVLEDPALYAPARMLKEAGTDRFTIPKLLSEFDADRIETFRAIYQSQAAIVAAHVADLAYVETFLYQNVWSRELEDRLTAELPWPEGKELSLIRWPVEHRLQKMAQGSPIPLTANLAHIALYNAGEWAHQEYVASFAQHEDSRIAEEATLALTHWRALNEVGLPRQFRFQAEVLLNACTLREQARVRLAALFPEKYPATDPALLSATDPDVRFAAAIAAGNIDQLRARCLNPNAPEPARYAALSKLASIAVIDVQVAETLSSLQTEHIVDVLGLLQRKKHPYPLLTDMLLRLLQQTEDPNVFDRAATLLSRDLSHETAIAISNINPADPSIATILMRSNMPPETFGIVGARLIDAGVFRASMYGMNEAAKEGRMPVGFVPSHYARAGAQREELIRFAEEQLGNRECEPLMDFLVRKCFEDRGEAQHAAWGSMSRLRKQESHQAVCPFQFEAKSVLRIFGTMDHFLRLLTEFLRRKDWREDVIVFSPLEGFLRYADDEVYDAVCETGSIGDYIDAIIELIDCEETRGSLRIDAFYPLIGIAAACPLLRPRIEDALRRYSSPGQEFEYQAQYALGRIVQLTGHPADTQ